MWDNGTVSNYWSECLTKYPNASELGSSNIGDTYFVVNENNIDHYPLIEPVSIKAPTVPDQEPSPAPSPSSEIIPTLSQPIDSPTTILCLPPAQP